jgi:hypothetical protein
MWSNWDEFCASSTERRNNEIFANLVPNKEEKGREQGRVFIVSFRMFNFL